MAKTAVNQFDVTPGNNTDVDGVGVGAAMTVDNTNDAFQHLMALLAQQMGEVGAMSADLASAATTDLATARGWFVNVTGTNTITSFGIVPAGKIFNLRMVNGLTLTYNAASMILPNGISLVVAAGDIVTMLSLGSGNWRLIRQEPAAGSALPPGTIIDYGGTTAPGGWLLCNGQAVSRTGYPLLFLAIGTAYGVGNGSTTFNVPDFRGRAAVGNDTMGSSASGRITTVTINAPSTNGGVGGAQQHQLTIAELPVHDHGTWTGVANLDHSHTYSGTTSGPNTTAHQHSYTTKNIYRSVQSGSTGNVWDGSQSDLTGVGDGPVHSHTYSGTTSGFSTNHQHQVVAQGGYSNHNNMQPSLICMKLIKT